MKASSWSSFGRLLSMKCRRTFVFSWSVGRSVAGDEDSMRFDAIRSSRRAGGMVVKELFVGWQAFPLPSSDDGCTLHFVASS